ncbi:MAG: ABC transporter ATP-binding protein [Verrucomicrobiales bacterium]
MPSVIITNLSKTFRTMARQEITALRDVNLTISPGSFTVLAGPSGSGKTTLLRIIAGLESPARGSVVIQNDDVDSATKTHAKAAFVFQEPTLYSHLTVRQNLIFPLLLRKASRAAINQRASELALLLRLEDMLDRDPETLSGGQKQRVALGRALASDAKLLLLDEPFSNLDPSSRAELRRELLQIKQELGLTVIYVTHDQAEALSMAEDLYLLRNGSMQQQGTPWKLYDEPESLFVASFFGIPPINIMEGMIMRVESGHWMLSLDKIKIEINQPEADLLAQILAPGTAGARVKIGIRPEHISATSHGAIAAEAERLEYHGDRLFAHWNTKLGRLSSHDYKKGEKLSRGAKRQLNINGAIHLFDPTTDKRMITLWHEPC